MRLIHQHSARLFRQAGGDEQHGRSATEGGSIELGLVDDEVLVEDGKGDAGATGGANKIVTTSKIVLVGEDAQGCGTVLLVRQRDDVGTSIFLNPAFRG